MKGRFVGQAACMCAILALVVGCKKAAPSGQSPALPVVPVSHLVERPVTDYVEYTGRIDAVQAVGVKARATGFLDPIPWGVKEGKEVPAGKLLFQIDPRPYKAQLEQAESQVDVVTAQLKLARVTLERAEDALKRGVGSKQDVDQAKAGVEEANGRVKAAQKVVETNRLNLGFTSVTAPVAGQIGRFYFTPGNLIVQDQTLLTTIVTVDPMYAYFDMDERTILKIRGQVSEGRIKPPASGAKVFMALEGETDFPHVGKIDFVNNVINPSTGTVSVRGVFRNPKSEGAERLLGGVVSILKEQLSGRLKSEGGESLLGGLAYLLKEHLSDELNLDQGERLLSPGMFVRIRLPIGEPHPGKLVVDRAIGSDQGLKYLYVVDAENKVQYRRIKTGPLQDDGLRVVEEGVEPGEWVVVGSLPQLRPHMEVTPEPVAMPIPGGPTPPPAGEPKAK